jgi:hypothetical protein
MQTGVAYMVFWAERDYQPIGGALSAASRIPWVMELRWRRAIS